MESKLQMELNGPAQNEKAGMQAQGESEESDEENLSGYQLARDRTRRQIRVPTRYSHAETVSFALSVVEETWNEEPQSYQEAISRADKEKWLKSMRE